MSDLCVSYDTLEDCESDLKTIQSEFEKCGERRDQLRGIWGSGEVADAMGDFVGNWDRHRKELVQSIKSVGEMVTNTLTTFKDTDKKLADNCKGD
ncbi:hypothetical protein AQ490_13105 [Wenjunlia vitaminophila]|uniref:WXG100 family type VII secretion target n=1 Tax=Wenjunlia vitaminophila TaxID=76728 RepID=A0A0T6LXZ3_WENVI|nr:hypothetical protein [Wenjunlia vitaminophila]KRV50885.1 hypothetical protein AQ490_13105 [Wenjunlia vitaminophila]